MFKKIFINKYGDEMSHCSNFIIIPKRYATLLNAREKHLVGFRKLGSILECTLLNDDDDDQSKYTSITHIGENRIRVIGEVTITIPKQYLSTLNVTKKKQFILIDFSITKDRSVILLKKAQ